jgi:predicted transcriptional regulator
MTEEPLIPEKVRLVIPLEKEVIDGIDELAKRMRRTKAWLVAEMLITAAERHDRFFEWLTFRIMGLLTKKPRAKIEGFRGGETPRVRSTETVYQQVFVSPGTIERVEDLASRLGRTRSDMAAELVTYAFEDEQFIIRGVSSEECQRLWKALGMPKGRQAKGNREENRKRRDDE